MHHFPIGNQHDLPEKYQQAYEGERFDDEYSHPIFTVQEIKQEPYSHGFGDERVDIRRWESELICNISWYNENIYFPKKIWELILITNSMHPDRTYAIRQCIEQLLAHNYRMEFRVHDTETRLRKGHKIKYFFGNLEEPWKSLFESLFTDGNWNVTKLLSSH